MPLPPGPRSRLLSTYRLMQAPTRWFPAWKEQFGDPYTVPAINGTVVITGEPEGIRQIFAAPGRAYLPFAPQASRPITGERSVFVTSGETHRRDRRLISQSFLAGRSRSYAPVMASVARRHSARIEDGQELKIADWALDAALEVILRTVFGLEEPERLELFRGQLERTMSALNPAFLFAPALQRHLPWLSGYSRFERERLSFAELVRDQVKRAQAGGAPGSALQGMIEARDEGHALDDEALLDQLRSLLIAGHETTATALAWSVGWLLRSPDALARLRAELETLAPDAGPDEILRLPYLEAVVSESLRIYPLLTEVMRVLDEPLELLGYHLEPGTVVAASVLLAHWREEVFPDPQAFRPERFLERRYAPTEYLPFGGGFRRCIGASFALVELRLLLAELLRTCDLELLDEGPLEPARRNITIAPSTGVRVRAKRRVPAEFVTAGAV